MRAYVFIAEETLDGLFGCRHKQLKRTNFIRHIASDESYRICTLDPGASKPPRLLAQVPMISESLTRREGKTPVPGVHASTVSKRSVRRIGCWTSKVLERLSGERKTCTAEDRDDEKTLRTCGGFKNVSPFQGQKSGVFF